MAQVRQDRNVTGLSSATFFPIVPWWSTGKSVTWALSISFFFFFFFFYTLWWFTDLNHYRGLIYLIPLCVSENIATCRFVGVLRELYFMFLKKKKEKKKKKKKKKEKPSQLQSHRLGLCKDNSHSHSLSLSLCVCVGNKALSKPFRYPRALKYHLAYFVDW